MTYQDLYDSVPPDGADLLLMVADDAGTRHYCLAIRDGQMIVYLDREGQPGAFRIPDAGADHVYYLILDRIDLPEN